MGDAASSQHLVDPQLLALMDFLPSSDFTVETLAERRAAIPPFQIPQEILDASQCESRMVPGPEGAPDVRVAIYRPSGVEGPLPAILHLHGGGFILGSEKMGEPVHRRLVAALRCVLVSVNYRLAPEHPYPAAIEDSYAALSWLFANAASVGANPDRIGLMGESAGGGLAAALALMARDRGEHGLAFQHLTYPMLDDRTCTTADPHPFAGQYVWRPASNHFGWSSLLGHEPGREGVSPYAAPARAEDLRGLPPTYLVTGALDLFVEEDLDYVRRLLRAGVPTECHVYPGAIHGFNVMPGADVSTRATADSWAALRRLLAG